MYPSANHRWCLAKDVGGQTGNCSLELLPVVAVVLGQENENGAKGVDVWSVDVSATDTLQCAIGFELRGEEARTNGTCAEPAAGSVYVELGTEYFCVEVVGT